MIAMHHSEGVVEPGEPAPGVSCGVADMMVNIDNNIACNAQVYSLSVPFLSFDGKNPVPFAAVATQGRTAGVALTQREMFTQINNLLSCEKEVEGRTPIAETLKQETLKLMEGGINETRKMSSHALYASVREKLFTEFVLKDSDGKVRQGLEDVFGVRDERVAWEAYPLFAPFER